MEGAQDTAKDFESSYDRHSELEPSPSDLPLVKEVADVNEIRYQIDYIIKAPPDLFPKLSSRKREDLFGPDFRNQKPHVKRQSMKELQQYLAMCEKSKVPKSEAYEGPGVIIDVLRSKSFVSALYAGWRSGGMF